MFLRPHSSFNSSVASPGPLAFFLGGSKCSTLLPSRFKPEDAASSLSFSFALALILLTDSSSMALWRILWKCCCSFESNEAVSFNNMDADSDDSVLGFLSNLGFLYIMHATMNVLSSELLSGNKEEMRACAKSSFCRFPSGSGIPRSLNSQSNSFTKR